MSAYVYEKRKGYAGKRFDDGICIDCPAPRLVNGWRCEECRQRNSRNRQKRYRLLNPQCAAREQAQYLVHRGAGL